MDEKPHLNNKKKGGAFEDDSEYSVDIFMNKII